jgi:hypothetical protein
MMADPIQYQLSFRDFRQLQAHMARRLFARHRARYGAALLGVVTCALFIAIAIVMVAHPLLAMRLMKMGYADSIYAAVILCLIAAILSLLPAIRLRLAMARLQVTDSGPLLGDTRLRAEDEGLWIERALVKTKYLWPAFEGVEIAKSALILILDGGVGLIVPATAFGSEAARLEFAALVQKEIERARQRQPK